MSAAINNCHWGSVVVNLYILKTLQDWISPGVASSSKPTNGKYSRSFEASGPGHSIKGGEWNFVSSQSSLALQSLIQTVSIYSVSVKCCVDAGDLFPHPTFPPGNLSVLCFSHWDCYSSHQLWLICCDPQHWLPGLAWCSQSCRQFLRRYNWGPLNLAQVQVSPV